MSISHYIELLKLRIGGMITLTAVIAYIAMVGTTNAEISWIHLLALIFVMMLGSASSAVVNHFYDRDIDRRMERTAERPLAKKAMDNPRNALWLAAALIIAAVGFGTWFFNPVMALHLFLGAFFYGVVYTIWLKRRTWLNIVIGGLAGSFAVMAGAASVHQDLAPLPLLLALLLFFWTPSHFWSLAIYLKEEYRKVEVPMLPVLIGEQKTAWAILFNSIFLVGSSILPWSFDTLGNIYLFGALPTGASLIYFNIRLIKDPSREEAWRNFIHSMRYLGLIFLFIVLDVSF
ncbi:heme o synthase [Magnetococcales bacterium HHB-1]